MAITAAAFAVLSNNSATAYPATPYTIVSADVTNGISIPPSFFTNALNYGQPGFVLEKMTLIFNTTVSGTNFSVVVKATKATTDVPNSAPPFPSANQGDATFNINTVGQYVIAGLTSARFLQPDGSLLLNFANTLGTTTITGLLGVQAPAGPRG